MKDEPRESSVLAEIEIGWFASGLGRLLRGVGWRDGKEILFGGFLGGNFDVRRKRKGGLKRRCNSRGIIAHRPS